MLAQLAEIIRELGRFPTRRELMLKRRADPTFPYHFRSERFYKIGRSNSSGRRERELVIQMPEKGVVVHSIRTDDPVGIERYWHRRFEEQDKRKNGEWFDLDVADVAAFKRRKFQ